MRSLRWILLLMAVQGQAAEAKVISTLMGVTVSAEQMRAMDDYADYRVKVSQGGRCYYFASSQVGSQAERMKALGAITAEGQYLLVPASCGGGNASKCRGTQVFKVEGKLSHLGYLTGRWDGQKPVVYDGSWFYDTGDQLEINDLLSHAESPRYNVAYRDKNGLRFDAAKTWELNAEQYAAARAGNGPPALLFRAGLAKLCGHEAELKAALKEAKAALPPQAWPRFQRSLKKIGAGQSRPNPFLPVLDCKDLK
jgi:hypothetical protein